MSQTGTECQTRNNTVTFNEKLFDKFPVDELLEPSNNSTVYQNRYWIIHEGSVLRFRQNKSWQCNALKELVYNIVATNPIYEGCEVQFFEFLYVPK